MSTADARLNLTEFDFTLRDHGSVMVLTPCNDSASLWIAEHLPEDVQQWGGGVVIEPRFIGDIALAVHAEGYVVDTR